MNYISECSLSTLITEIRQGKITTEQLVDELCDKLDKWDSKIHAFLPEIGRRTRLQNDLKALNKQFLYHNTRPILFGIPVGVKDIFRVDGFPTKAGSKLPEREFEGIESVAVTRLKEAGALIMGKTVTTEFAYFQPGSTRNPHNFDHTPGGSSSGSAAAVAAGFCPLALGTQTIGSITRPASFCGVFGFKPSAGRIPTDGVIPFSPTVDQIGFFTQDLDGIAITASVLCDDWRVDTSFSQKLPKLGIPTGKYLIQASKNIQAEFNKKITILKKSGYDVIDIHFFENIEDINKQHNAMIAYEFAQIHKDWYSQYKELYSPPSRNLIEKGNSVTKTEYEKAKKGIMNLRNDLMNTMDESGVDLWITPSTTTLAPKGLQSTGNPAMNLPWTYAGLPILSVPSGLVNGLPFGMQFAGKYNKDEIALQHLNKLL
ncbi:MAG: amidase [Candidatus Cloacimonetes bacterium]|nr:amidase [Candidatus Cloacimonadota bacterium]